MADNYNAGLTFDYPFTIAGSSPMGAVRDAPAVGQVAPSHAKPLRRSQRRLPPSNHSYAFVQLAYDAPGTTPKYLFQALAMARALQRLSAYPLLLLTNTTQLPDGTRLDNAFNKLNVHQVPVYEVPIAPSVKGMLGARWVYAYWKLQIWRHTQYEKLIWMDTDAILFRSIDWLFERTPMWGQKDNWICDASDHQQNWLCSGLMLIEPSEDTYDGLTKYAAEGSNKWWTNGDQKLIRGYFEDVKRQPVQLLDTTVASFGRCLGKLPNVRYSSPGPWNVPAFVHKSSVSNECFDFDVDAQMATIDGKVVNICTYHPLGPYWRDAFCDAMDIAGARTNETDAYCDDVRWSQASDMISDVYNAWS